MTDTLQDSLQQALGTGFRLDRELGGGGMSRVFVAHDLSLGRDVVVKVLSAESTSGLSGDRFRREIQVIAQLQHPHIVSILSAGSADGALYYTMPFVKGETLRERLQRDGRLPIADTVKLLRELLDALAFAHAHDVVHRDIKPENVLIEAGHALVADFGIAKALRESGGMTSAGFAIGTPAYMAPEQATADPTTNHRADLYAVGVVAYELLVGSPPFTGSAQQMITGHITTPAPSVKALRSDVPDALADLVARALEKEPSARPVSAAAMLAELESILIGSFAAGGTAAGTRASASRRATSVSSAPAGRRWWPIAAAVGVLAVLGAGSVFRRSSGDATTSVVADGAELIAVMPLGAVSDTSLARLGQDLVVTLSANFDGVGSLRSVDAATLLMKARKLPSPMPIADAQQLGRALSAGSVMTGTLVGEGDRVRASVVLYKVGSDSVLAKATAVAAPQDIAALTDSLTWSVLRQVWRRGTAPSPVLTGLTTASFDALRAFLDGERKFQRLEPGAQADYRRAFELDPNFAQAYLRYEYVSNWNLEPRDSAVYARLLTLVDRLPERERLWVEQWDNVASLPKRVAEWKALAARYPDYPPFLMGAADPIVHFGPIYGIPVGEALPILERLDALVPDHADTKMHLAAVRDVIGTRAESADAHHVAAALTSGVFAKLLDLKGDVNDAIATGAPMPPPDRALDLARAMADEWDGSYMMSVGAGFPLMSLVAVPYQQELVARMQDASILTGDARTALAFGASTLLAARGEWDAAIGMATQLEGSLVAADLRISSARLAVMGAWLEAVVPAAADRVVRRVRAAEAARLTGQDRIELLWIDGVMGVVLGDSLRAFTAVDSLLREPTPRGPRSARSVAGLWLNRRDPAAAADSLRAVSESMMREGYSLVSAEALGRLVVARALRARGEDAAVERYLMWPDALVNSARQIGAFVGASITEYERASAFDAAGNVEAAVTHYRQFVDNYDRPPAAHRAMVETAKARLRVLEETDAGRTRVVPRGGK